MEARRRRKQRPSGSRGPNPNIDKLDRVRAARESYLDYLREKYPSFSSSVSRVISLPPGAADRLPGAAAPIRPPREPIASRLETASYWWDLDRRRVPPPPITEPALRPLEAITSQGASRKVILSHEMPEIAERLERIKNHITELSNARLAAPTIDYFAKYAPEVEADLTTGYYRPQSPPTLPSLAEIRARILHMDLRVEARSREILDEAHARRQCILEAIEAERRRGTDDASEASGASIEQPSWLKVAPSVFDDIRVAPGVFEKAEDVDSPVNKTPPPKSPSIPSPVPTPSPDTKKELEPTVPRPPDSRTPIESAPIPEKPPTPAPPAPKEAEPEASADSSYNKILALLKGDKNGESDSSSEGEPVQTVQPGLTPFQVPLQLPTAPRPRLSLISQKASAEHDSDDDFFR